MADRQLFDNTGDMFDYLTEYYEEHGGTVDVSTFNMYLNIAKDKDWQDVYYSPVRNFINSVAKKDLRIVLGLPFFVECRPKCLDCMKKYDEGLNRHMQTVKQLDLNLRVHPTLHMKMYRIGNLYVSGGINLANSNYVDVAFVIDSKEQQRHLQGLFDNAWHESTQNIAQYKKYSALPGSIALP